MRKETSYPWLRVGGGAALVMATLRVVHMRTFSCLVSLTLSVIPHVCKCRLAVQGLLCARCESVVVCVLLFDKPLLTVLRSLFEHLTDCIEAAFTGGIQFVSHPLLSSADIVRSQWVRQS